MRAARTSPAGATKRLRSFHAVFQVCGPRFRPGTLDRPIMDSLLHNIMYAKCFLELKRAEQPHRFTTEPGRHGTYPRSSPSQHSAERLDEPARVNNIRIYTFAGSAPLPTIAAGGLEQFNYRPFPAPDALLNVACDLWRIRPGDVRRPAAGGRPHRPAPVRRPAITAAARAFIFIRGKRGGIQYATCGIGHIAACRSGRQIRATGRQHRSRKQPWRPPIPRSG